MTAHLWQSHAVQTDAFVFFALRERKNRQSHRNRYEREIESLNSFQLNAKPLFKQFQRKLSIIKPIYQNGRSFQGKL